MKLLYASSDFAFVGYLRGVLDDAGIRCIVKNEHLIGAVGELHANELELWVLDAGDFAPAERLLNGLMQQQPAEGEWTCERCGERMEAQFTACWACEGGSSGEFLA